MSELEDTIRDTNEALVLGQHVLQYMRSTPGAPERVNKVAQAMHEAMMSVDDKLPRAVELAVIATLLSSFALSSVMTDSEDGVTDPVHAATIMKACAVVAKAQAEATTRLHAQAQAEKEGVH